MRFECEKCGYKFVSETKNVGDKCPYCDKGKIAKDKDVDELLDSVE